MIRTWAGACAMVLMLALTCGAAHAQGTAADWLEKPSGEDVSQAYPALAQLAGFQGHATLSCEVARTGRLDNCRVVEETPRGLGFGKAALSLVPYFRMVPATAGGSAEVSIVRIPIRLVLPPGAAGQSREAMGAIGMVAVLAICLLGLALNDWLRGGASPRMPVGAATIYALRFAALAWRRTPGPLLLYVLIMAISMFQGQAGNEPSGTDMAVTVAAFVVGVLVNGAGLRLGLADLRPDDPDFRLGPLGLRLGRVETRIVATCLIQGLMTLGLVAALAVIGAVLASGQLPLQEDVRVWLAGGWVIVGAFVLAWFALRLWTLVAASVFRGRLALAESWKATRAALFSPLAAMMLILASAIVGALLPTFLLTLIGAALRLPDLMGKSAAVYVTAVFVVAQPAWIGLSVYGVKTLHQRTEA